MHQSVLEAAAVPVEEQLLNDNEDTWSTTAQHGERGEIARSRNKQIAAACISKQQAELIEKSYVKKALATIQTEEVTSGKKHARAYVTSDSPSPSQNEDSQIKNCIHMVKEVMDKEKVNILVAERMLLDLIIEKNRETGNETGSADSKILHEAVRRMRESGVE